MKRHTRLLLPIMALLLTSGCMAPYRLPQGAPSASLRLAPDGMNWICHNGERHSLRASGDGRAVIPAGARVTVGVTYDLSDGYTRETCTAASSIASESGARYYQDFEYERNRCRALVYRETEDQRVGLAFEPSAGPPGGSCMQ